MISSFLQTGLDDTDFFMKEAGKLHVLLGINRRLHKLDLDTMEISKPFQGVLTKHSSVCVWTSKNRKLFLFFRH